MFGVRRQTRLRSLAVVLAAHGAAIWLVLTFAHTSFIRERERIVDVFDVRPVEPPPPLPPPTAPSVAAPRPQGRSAPAARPAEKAVPRPVTPTIVTAPTAPPAPPSGGPQAQIDGTGGGGTSGVGSGQGAAGSGGGGLRPAIPARLSGGRIVPRDYPRAAGGAQGVVVAHVAVGMDGRVTGCTVARSSGNAILDATTCRLIRERFRFTPARNAQGEAVPGEFGWQQRWWRD